MPHAAEELTAKHVQSCSPIVQQKMDYSRGSQCCSLCLGRGTIKGDRVDFLQDGANGEQHSLHPTVVQEVAWGGIQVVWGAFPPSCQVLPVESLICLTASPPQHGVRK